MWVKALLKNILSGYAVVSDLNSIKKMIDTYPIISFDVFDTLLRRKVLHPSDVFDRVEKEYNIAASVPVHGFKRERIEAERRSRALSSTEETSIYAIYNQLPYRKVVKERLLRLELDTERSELSARLEIKELYDYALTLRKEILIISDMYLPIEFIEKVLYTNGYIGYSKLYLSSATGVSKSTGNMFRFILKATGYNAQDILHIGDNVLGDWLRPKLLHIKSICIHP